MNKLNISATYQLLAASIQNVLNQYCQYWATGQTVVATMCLGLHLMLHDSHKQCMDW